MYELVIQQSQYFKIEQIKADYYLITLNNFVILPGHTKLNTQLELNFEDKFLCILQLERNPIENGIILQATDFPENILNFNLVNLRNVPFFVEANTRIAKINFAVKQILAAYFIFRNNEINQ